MYTYDDALKSVRATLRSSDPTLSDESRVAEILEDETFHTSFGWLFFCNNAKYARTRKIEDMGAGAATILFNKTTGEIRRFFARSVEDIIQSYSKEVEGRCGTWSLWLPEEGDRKKAAIIAKEVFGISPKDALEMFPSVPCAFARGTWEAMTILYKVFRWREFEFEVKVAKEGFENLPEFEVYNGMGVRNLKTNQIIYPGGYR